jgi:hypothetical protein
MSYSVQTVSKRKLSEDANGQSFEVGLAALLNRSGVDVVSVSVGEQSVTVVLHHTVKAKSDK